MSIDYCLKNADEAEFNKLMLATGLCVEVTEGEDEEAVTTIVPASYEVLIDRIGPITLQTGVDENEEPIFSHYPEYYTNVRILGELTEEQIEAISTFAIDPSTPQYRTWA
jgi:predicted DNA binding protein